MSSGDPDVQLGALRLRYAGPTTVKNQPRREACWAGPIQGPEVDRRGLLKRRTTHWGRCHTCGTIASSPDRKLVADWLEGNFIRGSELEAAITGADRQSVAQIRAILWQVRIAPADERDVVRERHAATFRALDPDWMDLHAFTGEQPPILRWWIVVGMTDREFDFFRSEQGITRWLRSNGMSRSTEGDTYVSWADRDQREIDESEGVAAALRAQGYTVRERVPTP